MSFLDDFEDLAIFTKGEFADIATVDSSASAITELSGIFDENYQDMFGYGETQTAEGRKFCFRVQTAEIEGLRQGDLLTIKGKNYQIVSLQPKDDGKLTNIILKQDFS